MRGPEPAMPRGRVGTHEALWRAIREEYASRAFHTRIVAAFGARQPFPTALKDCERRIRQCVVQLERLGAVCPLDPFAQKPALISSSWSENCGRALRGEAAKAARLRMLAAAVDGSGVEGFLKRLSDEALEKTAPAFQRALADAVSRERMHAAKGVPPEAAHIRHGPLGDFLEQAFSLLSSQHGAFGALGPLVRNTEPALLGGIAAGAATVYFTRQKLGRKRKEE